MNKPFLMAVAKINYRNNSYSPNGIGDVQVQWHIQHWVSISAPFSVIRMVCSNCAERLPSSVTTVQLSSHIIGLMLPIVSIGSANLSRV